MGGYFADTVESRVSYDPDDLDDYSEADVPEIVVRDKGGASPGMKAYFEALEGELQRAYGLARACRAKGLDPELDVEIPLATDLAQRVEELMKDFLPDRGVAERIRELSREMNRELCSLVVAKEVAAGRFGQFDSKEKAVEGAIRVGLAILTEGILVAPLEGIAGVRILHNDDGTDCVAVSYAGPIRAAGGTGQALSVLIADVVRRELGIGKYKPTRQEVDRLKEEIPAYKRSANLQYTPTNEEIELIAKGCPIMIDGEKTEDEEVGGNRDLPRIETNNLRGGACLVMAEGMCLKAPKIQKHVKNLKLEGWEFIDTFVNKGKKKDEPPAGGEADAKPVKPRIDPNPKFISELVAGRPVFAHPSRKGGWRLRYGRGRTCGLATLAIHPASMPLLDDFLAVGTQMKIERPGKATVATPCDTIEGPIVLLHNGSLVEVTSTTEALEVRPKLKRIIDLGELLVPFGEFAENNKTLPQSSFCIEWWEQLAQRAAGEAPVIPTSEEAFAFAERTKTPLHPRFNLFWHDLAPGEIRDLSRFVEANGHYAEGALTLPRAAVDAKLPSSDGPAPGSRSVKDLLIELGALHEVEEEKVTFSRYGHALVRCLGLEATDGGKLARRVPLAGRHLEGVTDPCEFVSALAGVRVMPRAPHRIGTRMGRPEKAAERKMSPPVHLLFPIGLAGGAQRLLAEALKQGKIEVEIAERVCPQCGDKTVLFACPKDGAHTNASRRSGRVEPSRVDLPELLRLAQDRLGMERAPETVKAVQGIISKAKTPEPIEKGLLRAKHGLFTFKDGTIRFDMSDITLSHFKPGEIHVSVERLRELGYAKDVKGAPLERDDQVLELRVQDIVVSRSCIDYMFRCAQYVDDLLVRFYGMKPYYNCKAPEDMIGHLFVALAPHTSGGVLCRVIGWTKAQGHFGHPYFHAAKRRNCDGDEDCIMLLLDGLLNFSRLYLPSNRGGLMDAPLTLTLRVDPSEVDKEAHNVDTLWRYPLEFYEATCNHPTPKDVEKLVETVASRLGKPDQYEGFGFTHDTADIAEGPDASAYKTIGSMMDKMEAQLGLALKLRAVDAPDVAARVIGSHFLPDLMGNLKAFSKQAVRCTKCNAKYRRIPLQGKCIKRACTGNLTMTVYEASVKKYLDVSKQICEKYSVNNYVRQRIEHIEDSIDSLFHNDRVKKAKLSDFF